MNKQLTPKGIENPARLSGYDCVEAINLDSGHGGGNPYRARAGTNSPPYQRWIGPRRSTALEAAQDYCDYANGNPGVLDHTPSTGRPDFYMDENGTLHRDLPPETTVRKALKKKVIDTPERKLMLDMTPRLREVLKSGDLCEAKAGVSRAQIMTAVSQLKLGRFEKGVAGRNFLLVPERPSELHAKWVENEGIILVTP
jgi:hypothetical protein